MEIILKEDLFEKFMKKDNIRSMNWIDGTFPLTSPRVARILSKPEESRKLVDAVRRSRKNRLESSIQNNKINSPDLEELNSLPFAGFCYEKEGIGYVEKIIRKAEDKYWFPKLRSFYREALAFKKNYDFKKLF